MKLDDLKEEHLLEIIRMYEEKCGRGRPFDDVMRMPPSEILRRIKEGRSPPEYRVGSRWDGNSKIYLETDADEHLVVRFYHNLVYSPKSTSKQAEKAGEAFERAVKRYLNPAS
ncbi:MAG TPA: hypothetical protein VJB08_07185 [Candidatus Nanoarchaeia archaeon]|nr:hypothetical protein [Candidatus Nanoarchaeia archaeon]